MGNTVKSLKEEDVQKLIADYPWLLNIDYEVVLDFSNKGMEYPLSSGKRADLILRDKASGRPVIVEFKAVPFNRQDIGQVLEYKARVISESTNDNSTLKDVFDDRILSPITVLVVPSCDAEARLACNLANIDVFEYEKTVPQILIPEKLVTLEEFKKSINSNYIPFDETRNEQVNRVYSDIRSVLNEENLMEGWTNYRSPSGEYNYPMFQLFINKLLFSNNIISMGIYEEIFDDSKLNSVVVEFYSLNKEALEEFKSKYKELKLQPKNSNDLVELDDSTEFYWSFYVDKKTFLEKTKETIKPFIKNYNTLNKLLTVL